MKMRGGDVAKNIAESIGVNIGEPDCRKLFGHPPGTGLLTEGRSRNSHELDLTVYQCLGIVVQPCECDMNGALRGKGRDTGKCRATREDWHAISG